MQLNETLQNSGTLSQLLRIYISLIILRYFPNKKNSIRFDPKENNELLIVSITD